MLSSKLALPIAQRTIPIAPSPLPSAQTHTSLPLSKPGLPPSLPTTCPALTPAKSHQSGAIDQHWNDLPTSFLSAPSSRAISRSTSPLPTGPTGPAAEDLPRLLTQLFAASTGSTLSMQEKMQLHARVSKARITAAQSVELAGVLEPVLARRESKAWGRERVVEFVVRNSGVAGWAGAVRRGVESLE